MAVDTHACVLLILDVYWENLLEKLLLAAYYEHFSLIKKTGLKCYQLELDGGVALICLICVFLHAGLEITYNPMFYNTCVLLTK